MISPFTARRRAEELAAAIDGTGSAGAHRVEMDRLVGVVTALRSHPEVVPRAEFSRDLRARLLTEAATVLTAENAGLALPARTRGARERRLVAVASAVVLIGGTAGMAAAAQDALPGEALYPVKRGIERAEAGLSISEAGKGRDLLNQAGDRLTEVRGLLAKDSVRSAPQVPETLDDFSAQATEGANLLLDSFRDSRDPSSVTRVRTFAADGIAELTALADSVPPEAQDELAAAAVTLRDLDARAATACSTCASDLPDLEIPGLILARNEVDRALDAALPAELDNSHPVVVPKGTVQKQKSGDTPGDGPRGTDGDAVTSPAPAPTDGAPSVPGPGAVDPGELKTPSLPSLEEEVSDGTKKLTEAPGTVVEDLSDGLGGVVETLLPDSGLDDTTNKLLP